MRGRLVAMLVVMVAGAACAQDGATPLHPLNTAPEGQKPNCQYGFSATGKNNVSGTNTCAPAPAPIVPAPDAVSSAAAAQQQPSAAAPSAAQRFPFPGESAVPDAPGMTDQEKAAAREAQEEAEKRAQQQAAPATTPGLQDAGSSGSSSSSTSSSSATGEPEPVDPATPPGDAAPAPKRGRKQLPKPARQTSDEREEEDIKVAQFYMNDSNWRAAYLRGQDAVAQADGDWEAHLTLAESARKLGKLDEAVKEYKRCLALDPTPKEKKEAEKALKEMVGGGGDTLLP